MTLTARVTFDNGMYVARVEQLPIEATGGSPEEAKEELTEAFMSWLQTQDIGEALEVTLGNAGFPGVDEETEVQLEFVD